jgi:hypothetical protein
MPEYVIVNEVARQRIFNEIDAAPVGTIVTIDFEKKYSAKQRGALHVWCQMIADTLNECGQYRVRVSPISKQGIEIPWSMQAVKEDIYKPVLMASSGKKSTEDQTSKTPSKVALIICKHFADAGIICPPWPSYV